MKTKIRTYNELMRFSTFEERFNYLKIGGRIGIETFGGSRFLNQDFYRSREWRNLRNYIFSRDNGCDLACDGYDIFDWKVVRIHHMNPIEIEDIEESTDFLTDPNFLITTVEKTHKAIHYSNDIFIPNIVVERRPNDTCLWKV